MIVEVAGAIDGPIGEVETPSIAPISKTGRTTQEIEPERHRLFSFGDTVRRGLGEHVSLARGDPQTAIIGGAGERAEIEMLVK